MSIYFKRMNLCVVDLSAPSCMSANGPPSPGPQVVPACPVASSTTCLPACLPACCCAALSGRNQQALPPTACTLCTRS